MSHFDHLLEFYQSGSVPWDQPDPPPEVLAFGATLPVGQALDLAQLDWQVDGVDFIPQAVAEATIRARQAGLNQVQFHLGLITQLDFLAGPYDFALDVGCAHNFTADELRTYQRELLRLLKPGVIICSLPISARLPRNRRRGAGWMKSTCTRSLPRALGWRAMWMRGRQWRIPTLGNN